MENREIKFRAWDKKNEVMINVLEIRFLFEDEKGLYVEGYCDCNHGAIQDHENHKHPIFPKNLELMQYTGIKDRKDDKNNKEIYEGDIVKVARSHTKNQVVEVQGTDPRPWRPSI